MDQTMKLERAAEPGVLEQVLRFGRDLEAAMEPLLPTFLRAVSDGDKAVGDPYWRGILSGENGCAILARAGGRPVGMALVTYGKTAHLESLFVAPEYRKQGVGGALLVYAKRTAAERGYAVMTLNVLYGNEEAQRLYAGSGFAGFRTTMAAAL